MFEIFNNTEFSVIALTAVLNNVGHVPGQLGVTGVFDTDSVATTSIKVVEENGDLMLVEPTPRGAPGVTVTDDDRTSKVFEVDHYEINDAVMADEVQGVRAFGDDTDVLETVQGRVERKLARHARNMDMTLEHQRIGAIKGLVVSKSGKVLHNLYDRFEIAQPANIVLGLGATVVGLGKMIKDDVVIPIEDDLDAAMTGMHAMCGSDFHSAMWAQKELRETFLSTEGAGILRQEVPDIFTFAGITFERYKMGRKARSANGNASFIASNEARVFPVGVPDLFITRFAPADWEETVNTDGLPRYARQYAMANGKGRHLDSQMNAISLCTRPGVLRTLTI